jgi:cytochrome c oxidase subunit IV
MRAPIVSPTTTVVVLLALLVLTGITVAVSFVHLSPVWHLAIGLLIAVAKAALVVLFFMHVIHSPAATRAVIVVAVFWLLGVLMALTFSDYTTRETVSVPRGAAYSIAFAIATSPKPILAE